jgi:hypothetical protein
VEVWDGETGERRGGLDIVALLSVAAWKEHTGEGEHDRIATANDYGIVKVWDAKALTLVREIVCGFRFCHAQPLMALESAKGAHRLLVAPRDDRGSSGVGPRGGPPAARRHQPRLLNLFESAQGRQLLAIGSQGIHHPRHPGDLGTVRAFLDVWDLGKAPARAGLVKPAHHLG